MTENNIVLLEDALHKLKIVYDNEMIDKFIEYKKMVLEWNEKINLTAIVDEKEFIIKHFIDSIMCASFPDLNKLDKVIDVGTGAGFPGIPLSIIFPDKEFLLVDSLNKRVNFLSEVIENIGLNNVKALHGRAEDLGQNKLYREQFDLCVSRAVAKLNVLSEYCLPFVKIGGYFAAYKSKHIKDEIDESRKAIRILGGEIAEHHEEYVDSYFSDHQIIYIKKNAATPLQFPRKAGNPTKSPL
ncbi:MAG: 16S rRNA (guanine(527)-N(7))-methyltransferase RsmG [Clostridiales bacterium]|nr:16S rRNA (guanine(527)-N(7))-methyltransferase RsmG [Clostridiales bacterium]